MDKHDNIQLYIQYGGRVRQIRWSLLKNKRLKRTRGVSFEEVAAAELIGARSHPRRPGQAIMFFKLRGYVWVVPYVNEGEYLFLKTVYPSRKYTKMYREVKLR